MESRQVHREGERQGQEVRRRWATSQRGEVREVGEVGEVREVGEVGEKQHCSSPVGRVRKRKEEEVGEP